MVMCVGMFIALLDIQIVASSLQDIGGGLSAAQDQIGWVQTSYLVAEIIVIPLSGWLTRVFSTRWLFTFSAAGFTLASMLCGFAWSIESMIVFRALQGLLGASMIPTVFTSSFHYFQGPRRVYAAAVVGSIASIAPTLGPVIGGWITDTLNWHWLFYVNVIPGTIITILVALLVKIDKADPSLLKGADYIGMVLMAVSLGTAEYVLEEGTRWNWFDDADDPQRRHRCQRHHGSVRHPQPDLCAAGGRLSRLRQPQLRHWLLSLFRHRHRHLCHDLSDAAVSRLCPRLRRLPDRGGGVFHRRGVDGRRSRLHLPRQALRHALADDVRAGILRRLDVEF